MKTIHEYVDGDWVIYKNPKSEYHLYNFQAYKSQWTSDAFRLKRSGTEVIADISEIEPVFDKTQIKEEHENSIPNLPRGSRQRDSKNIEEDFFQD
jgi:hypothetical protein